MTKARDLANASTALSAVSATELGYVDGVTSAIQTQIDAKAPSSTAATLTGTQTLTNKTIDTASNTITGAVTLTGTQTLTNKTLTSPALTTPTISTATTNGDILYGTGSGALARLGIGTTGQVLNVASGVPAWATVSGAPDFLAGKNKIINGDFGVWQRGTSFTPSAGVTTFTADRWRSVVNSGTTISRQTFTPGTAPIAGYEGQFYFNATITANNQNYEHGQFIEDARTFAGQTVTLSFWARSTVGAQAMGIAIYQSFGTGGSPSSLTSATFVSGSVGSATYTPTGSWVRYTFTYSIPSVSGKTFGTNNDSYLWIRTGQYTTTATNTSIDYWGVQVEAGSTATPFTTATGTIQGELAACQRYYYRWSAADNSVAYINPIWVFSSTAAYGAFKLPQTMRVKPASIETSGTASNYRFYAGSGSYTCTSVPTLDVSSADVVNLGYFYSTGGLTVGQAGAAGANTSTSAYIGFNSEL